MTPLMIVATTLLGLGGFTMLGALAIDYVFGRDVGFLAGLVMLVGVGLGAVGLLLWIIGLILLLV